MKTTKNEILLFLGQPMTDAEFNDFIKAGEKGSFMTSVEFKKKLDIWKKGLEK